MPKTKKKNAVLKAIRCLIDAGDRLGFTDEQILNDVRVALDMVPGCFIDTSVGE